METKKNLYIINPPCFEEFNTERNIYSTDGILCFLNSIVNEEYNVTYYDYSLAGETILKLFEHISRNKPDEIFLNLNEYEISCNVNLAIGIKKNCPNCKLIVGCNQCILNNVSEEIINADDEWFYYTDNSYRLKNLSLEDIDNNIFYIYRICYRFCRNKKLFTPIFYTKNGFINKFSNISKDSELFISFRFFKDCDFDTFYSYVSDLKEKVKKLRFIIDGGCFSRKHLKILKKIGLVGIVYTLNSISEFYFKSVFINDSKFRCGAQIPILFRFPTTDLSGVLEFINGNIFFELTWNGSISFDKFYIEKKLLMFNFLSKILFKNKFLGKFLDKIDFHPIGYKRKYYKHLFEKIRFNENCRRRMDVFGSNSFEKKTFSDS